MKSFEKIIRNIENFSVMLFCRRENRYRYENNLGKVKSLLRRSLDLLFKKTGRIAYDFLKIFFIILIILIIIVILFWDNVILDIYGRICLNIYFLHPFKLIKR